MTTVTKTERDEAIERLHEWIKPGDELYTVLRHVSRSGMLRIIDVIGIGEDDYANGKRRIMAYGWNVAKAIKRGYDSDRNGIRVSGCGMDMGFEVVYSLSRVLFRDGFECIGDGCPSNDHSNGDRDYTPHHHSDGGYALRQRWI